MRGAGAPFQVEGFGAGLEGFGAASTIKASSTGAIMAAR
jgi:hypothetical protein